MRRIAVIALAVTLGAGTAQASSSGSAALALGALVGKQSPRLPARDKRALRAMLAGHAGHGVARGRNILVKAGSVTCRASDVDIAAHACTLGFGARTRTLKGRRAHELYATLIENGVGSDGAAGSIFEAVKNLSCVIDPREVARKSGGGARCAWTAT